MAKILKSDGTVVTIIPNNKKAFTLAEARAHIGGGYITVIYRNNFILLVDEEGIPKNLPRNKLASTIAQQNIVGDCLICLKGEFL